MGVGSGERENIVIYEVFTSSEFFIAVSFIRQFSVRACCSFWLCFEAINVSESQMLFTNAGILPAQALGDPEFASPVELTLPTLSTPYQLFDLTS